MKIKFLVLSWICLSSSVFSQDKRFSLSTNLLNLVALGPSLSLAYQHTPKLSFQVYGSSGKLDRLLFAEQYRFKTVVFDARYFILQSIFEGMYAGPYIRYIDKKVQNVGFVDNTGFFSFSGRDFRGQGISSGLVLGAQVQRTKLVNFELFGGAGYGKYISQIDYSGGEKSSGFFDVRVGALLGFKL